MANFNVGDRECTFAEIIAVIETTPASVAVLDDWRKFGRVLGTNQVKINKFHNDLLLDKLSTIDVIEGIVIDWRSRKAREATLGALLSIIEEQCDWQDVADSVRKLIKTKAVQWSDLDEKSKKDVLEAPVEFFGRTTTLSEIEKTLGSSKMSEILNDFLKKDLLRRTLDGAPLSLDSGEREKPLPYYVQRTLTIQRQLDPEIFKAKCTDIFVIQGIQRNQLSTLAYPERTDSSGKQVKKINVRFILLECDSDYETLCEKTEDPIHRIVYENGNFIWTSTMGSMQIVRRYLLKNTEKISENAMVTQKLADYNTRPIAIADRPGMGKTVLLSQISRQVAECYPERYVLNISFQRLFPSIENHTDEMLNLPVMKRNLAECSSCTPLGQEILFELMNCEAAKFEIFLDAFDEIPSSYISPLEQMLKLLMQSDNLRAFITTRKHMRDELEQTIGVISWNIHPFTISDQTDFFVRYWTSTLNCENTSRLQEFVADFVRDILSNHLISGSADKNDFAGLPIKCFMLAQVNSGDAKRYLTSNATNSGEIHVMETINELYQKFMTFRFENVPQTERASVMQAHLKAAIQLLFPNWVDQLKEFLEPADSESKPVDSNVLFCVGILQDVNPPKFTHRTFAEYLVADFLVSTLMEKCTKNSAPKLIQFLFEAALTLTTFASTCCQGYSENLVDEFVSVLRSSTLWPHMNKEYKKMAGLNCSDLVALFPEESNEKSAENIIHYWFFFNPKAQTYGSLVNMLQNEMEWPLDICSKLLNIPSVQRRGYQHPIVAYFINAFLTHDDAPLDIKNISLEFLECLKQYTHTNLLSSTNATWFYENFSMCAKMGHTNILKLLIAFSVDTVDYSNLLDYNWTTPILAAFCHDDLFFQTISQFVEKLYGKNLFQLDLGTLEFSEEALTPLHKAVQHGNYELVEYLITKYTTNIITTSKRLIWYCVRESIAQPIWVINRKMEIISLLVLHTDKSILDELLPKELSVCSTEYTAVTAPGIHVKLFKHLIELGADTGQTFDTGTFAAMVVTRFLGLDLDEMVDFLAEQSLLELLFRKSLNGNCSLESILYNCILSPQNFPNIRVHANLSCCKYRNIFSFVISSKWAPDMVKAIVESCNNVNLADSHNATLLNWAAENKSLTNIKYLVSVGADVNHFNDSGWSPLMHAMYVCRAHAVDPNLIHECIQVLLEAGANVNARNRFGKTLFDFDPLQHLIKNLNEETLDLLVEKSGGTYFRNNHGVIEKRMCIIS